MKKKNKRNSIAPKNIPNAFLFMTIPASKKIADKLADELVKWAATDNDAIVINEFFAFRGITRSMLKRYIELSERLEKAYNIALSIIGARREKRALIFELNHNMVKYNQSIYDKEWAELEERKANLKNTSNDSISKEEVSDIIASILKPVGSKGE